MEEFTNVNSRRQHVRKAKKAAESARILSDVNVPGALWTDMPLSHCHLPGIPYSYYDDEIVMLRKCTAVLVEQQRAEARAHARVNRNRKPVSSILEGGPWSIIDQGKVRLATYGEVMNWH